MDRTNDTNDHQPVDATGDPLPKDADGDDAEEPTGPATTANGREIVVPLRLYKTVTVFSTLIAVVTFLIGFTFIDAATLQVSFVRSLVVVLLDSVGVRLAPDVLAAILAIAGVAFILGGTAVYVLGARFRAQGMGKPQEDSSEG